MFAILIVGGFGLLAWAIIEACWTMIKRMVSAANEPNVQPASKRLLKLTLLGTGGIIAIIMGGAMLPDNTPKQVHANTTAPAAAPIIVSPASPAVVRTSEAQIAESISTAVDTDEFLSVSEKEMFRAAVRKALLDEPTCLSADTVGKSSDKNTAKDTFFIHCNGPDNSSFNIRFSKEDLEKGNSLALPKPFDGVKALQACRELIKGKLNHPSTYDESWYPADIKTFPEGNTWVGIDFSYKNSFGLEIKMRGSCDIDPSGSTKLMSVKEMS
ncbi:MAG: hypothetical protein DI585_01440 [Pseudomonas fluorescens]|nr:MAG: hypothetical protein DI585_01440 [Pseudomonas fluorescens]